MANAAARRISVVSFKSGTTSPLTHHRFDHMIGEQKNIVTNAQEGLKQSLLILEKATTKEEIESAKLQVESLLPRCEELLTKLMVIIHVRSELDCLQKDLLKAKKDHLNASKIYARQQWLENRLEKLVFSKRRARPGVRLQRNHATTQDTRLLQNQRAYRQQGVGCQYDKNQATPSYHKRSATVSTISNLVGFSPSDDIKEFSKSSMTSSELSQSDQRTTVTEHDHLDTTVGRDSIHSVWNSESEANWTVADGYSTISAGKKHMLSDEYEDDNWEHKKGDSPQQDDNTLLRADKPGCQFKSCEELYSDCTSFIPFENPRPIKVFGSASWNLLCMPKYSSFMDDYKGTAQGPPDEVLRNAVINKELSVLWTDLMKLQELVQFAGNITRTEGQTLPPLPSRNLTTSHRNRESKVSANVKQHFPHNPRPASEFREKKFQFNEFPDILPDIFTGMSPLNKPSLQQRKTIYPKSSLTFLHLTNSRVQSSRKKVGESERAETDWNDDLHMSLPSSRLKLSSRLKSARLRNLTSLVNEHLDDYKEENTKELISVLQTNDCMERRHDAAQALGCLIDLCHENEIITVLRNAVVHDTSPNVKHQAIKSLIKYGAWNAQLYYIVNELLSRGNSEMQCDILTAMMENKSISKDLPSNNEDIAARLRLLTTLKELVMNDCLFDAANEKVLINAAILLSECCVINTRADIKQVLKNLLPTQESSQMKAKMLDCLVNICGCTDDQIIKCAYEIAEQPIEWKIRLCGVQCLALLYQNKHFVADHNLERETAVRFAKDRLVSEPIHMVRKSICSLLTLFGEKEKTESELIRKLESTNEMERAEATIALSAFASGNKKVQNALMDVIEYDPSQFIKLLVLSLIDKARPLNPLSISRLQAKCVGKGPLAKHCRAAMSRMM